MIHGHVNLTVIAMSLMKLNIFIKDSFYYKGHN